MAQERSEAPTPHRREKAREEGQIAVSRDLIAGASLLAACLAARSTWDSAGAAFASATRWTFALASADALTPPMVEALARVWAQVGARAVAPAVVAAMVVAALVGLAQTRLLFSPKALQPKLEKLSPVNGLKRMLSVRGAVEAVKGALKVGVILGAAAWALWARRQDLSRFPDCSVLESAELMASLCFSVGIQVGVLLVIVGVADYAYQWWETERSLRMSRQELMEEYKQLEGDPHVRARRRALRRNMLQQGISREANQATVVVTNPTHIAVALLYWPGMVAPRVVAKGRSLVAQRIVAMAVRNGIPVVRNVEVARALYKSTSLGDYIPSALYQAVAEILAVLYRRAQERRARQRRYYGGQGSGIRD